MTASGTRLRVQDARLRASKYGMLAETDAPGEAERGAGRRHVKSSALPVSPTMPIDSAGRPQRAKSPIRFPSNEQATVRAILQFLAAHRIPAWRVNSGAVKIERRFLRFGAVGMSDVIAVLPPNGQFVAVEVKSLKGKVTPAQQGFLDQVNAAGGRAFVARSVLDVARELGLP